MSGLTRDEVEVFANGLYYLANIDGMDDKEESLIREFLTESGTDLTWEEIAQDGFDPVEAAGLLRGTFLRRIFISAAVAVVKADGEFSAPERRALLSVVADREERALAVPPCPLPCRELCERPSSSRVRRAAIAWAA